MKVSKLWQILHYFIIYAKIWANTLEGLSSSTSYEMIVKIVSFAYTNICIHFLYKNQAFSTIYHLFLPTKRCCALSLLSQVSYTNYPCFILIFVLLYVWGSARCAVGGCSLQETCSEVLDQSLDWSLSKTANSSGVGTNIECRVRFRWHDSGDMPKSSCSCDLLIT